MTKTEMEKMLGDLTTKIALVEQSVEAAKNMNLAQEAEIKELESHLNQLVGGKKFFWGMIAVLGAAVSILTLYLKSPSGS